MLGPRMLHFFTFLFLMPSLMVKASLHILSVTKSALLISLPLVCFWEGDPCCGSLPPKQPITSSNFFVNSLNVPISFPCIFLWPTLRDPKCSMCSSHSSDWRIDCLHVFFIFFPCWVILFVPRIWYLGYWLLIYYPVCTLSWFRCPRLIRSFDRKSPHPPALVLLQQQTPRKAIRFGVTFCYTFNSFP